MRINHYRRHSGAPGQQPSPSFLDAPLWRGPGIHNPHRRCGAKLGRQRHPPHTSVVMDSGLDASHRPGMTAEGQVRRAGMTAGENCGTMARRARFRFTPTPNQWLCRSSRSHRRGGSRASRTRDGDVVDARASARRAPQGELNLVSGCAERAGRRRFERTAKPCGPDTRCWCQVGGDASSPTGVEKSPSRRRR